MGGDSMRFSFRSFRHDNSLNFDVDSFIASESPNPKITSQMAKSSTRKSSWLSKKLAVVIDKAIQESNVDDKITEVVNGTLIAGAVTNVISFSGGLAVGRKWGRNDKNAK